MHIPPPQPSSDVKRLRDWWIFQLQGPKGLPKRGITILKTARCVSIMQVEDEQDSLEFSIYKPNKMNCNKMKCL